jgi:hypothetical protein
MPRKKPYVSIAIAISDTIPLPPGPTGRKWKLVINVTKPIPGPRHVISATPSIWYIPKRGKLPDSLSPVPQMPGLALIQFIWFISKLVDQNFNKNWIRVRKERKIAPQASAGNPLSLKTLPEFRKRQRRREKKVSEISPNPPPPVKKGCAL